MNSLRPFGSGQGIPLLVEGKRDKNIIEHLTRELEQEYSISKRGGESEILSGLEVVIDVQIPHILVVLDVDERSPADIYRKCYDKIDGNFNEVEKDENIIAVSDSSVVHVAYAGLPEDEDIAEIGITQHTIEDHILKLLLTHDETVRRMTDTDIHSSDELKEAITEVNQTVEGFTGGNSDGKTPLDIAKMLLGYHGPTGSFINDLLQATSVEYADHASVERLCTFMTESHPASDS